MGRGKTSRHVSIAAVLVQILLWVARDDPLCKPHGRKWSLITCSKAQRTQVQLAIVLHGRFWVLVITKMPGLTFAAKCPRCLLMAQSASFCAAKPNALTFSVPLSKKIRWVQYFTGMCSLGSSAKDLCCLILSARS